ncbi:MAG: hypothetical protein ABI358_04200 [Ginsengibacter sp.]
MKCSKTDKKMLRIQDIKTAHAADIAKGKDINSLDEKTFVVADYARRVDS